MTPLETAKARVPGGRVVAVPVLRAGCGTLDAFLQPVTSVVEVGYFALERNEMTAVGRRYSEKVPKRLEDTVVCLLDPMLATSGSVAMAIEGPKSLGARRVRLRCVVTAPEGVAYLEKRELEAEVYTGALDRPLNDCQYILRGPGDFGDRLVGT